MNYKDFFKKQIVEGILSEVSLTPPLPFPAPTYPTPNPETPRVPLPDPYAPNPFNPYKPQIPVRRIRP